MHHLKCVAATILCLAGTIDAQAQDTGQPSRAFGVARATLAAEPHIRGSLAAEPRIRGSLAALTARQLSCGPPGTFAASAACVKTDAVAAVRDLVRQPARATRSIVQGVIQQERRSRTRVVLGVIVGAAAGFFAGGYTGAWIEGDGCHCDDPGLKGALIGAPVGAVTGGILGGLYLF
jgi:hypothetical protein